VAALSSSAPAPALRSHPTVQTYFNLSHWRRWHDLFLAVGIEHRVDVDAVAVLVVVVVAKGVVAVDIVIAVLVAEELDTVWNGESLRETLSVLSGSLRAAISIGEQDRDRWHSAGVRSLGG